MTKLIRTILLILATASAAYGFNRCGTSFSNAGTKCIPCPIGIDSECPAGNHCYSGLASCTPSSSVMNRCGTSFSNAGTKCIPCPKGIDSECPTGNRCYAGLPKCTPSSGTGKMNRCGTSASNAGTKCIPCPRGIDSECPSGNHCYAGFASCSAPPGPAPSGGPCGLARPISCGCATVQGTGNDHSGVDIFCDKGTPVYAAGSGTIIYSEYGHTGFAPPKYPQDTPNSILIKLDSCCSYSGRTACYIWYTHLSSLVYHVTDGGPTKRVSKGTKLGATGVGRYIPHLHFGIIINRAQKTSADYFSTSQVIAALGLSRNQKI